MKIDKRKIETPTEPEFSPKLLAALRRSLKGFLPPPKLSLSEYAEKHFSVTGEFSSVQGPISLRLTPYMREILDTVTNPKYSKITWLSSTQSGKTTLTMIVASYYIQHNPKPILFLEPNEALAESISNERFASVIRANPTLKSLLSHPSNKNTTALKTFPGGILAFGSAGSFNDVISRPIAVLLMDEVDAWVSDLKSRGNPLRMAEDRTLTFHDRKIITCSTPGTEGISNITEAYQNGDQRVYMVPCLHCGELQELVFKNIKWSEGSNGKDAWYQCDHCGEKIQEHQRHAMVQAGQWISMAEGEPGHASFKLSQLYSLFPNVSLSAIAQRFVQCKRKNDVNDLKVFTNQVLAETWSDQHLNNLNAHELADRAEYYKAEVPMGVGVLTAGLDWQADRVAVTVLGWGKDNQCWLIDHHEISGNPMLDPDLPHAFIYQEVEKYLNKPFRHESGRDIFVRTAFFDVGAPSSTHFVRKFCFQRSSRKFYACMGSRVSTDACFSGKNIKDHNTKHPVFYVGTIAAKDELFFRLGIKSPNLGGYIHFPKDLPSERHPKYAHLGDEYFNQLTSEKLVEKKESGVAKRIWVKKTGSIRNEALDCFVYGLAAFYKEFASNMRLLDEVVDFLNVPLEVPAQPEPFTSTPPPPAFDFFAAKRGAQKSFS